MMVGDNAAPDRSNEMTHAEAVARARALAETVRARAPEIEAQRRVPEDLIRDFMKAGLVRLLTPRVFGGHEMSLDTYADATIEIAKADASVGWCFSFLIVQSWVLATFPEAAQRDVWGATPDVALAISAVPAGQATRVEGGLRISGDWPWASGIDHCDWAMLAGIVADETASQGAPPDLRLFLIPKADYEIADTWFVSGLRGTGSKNVRVKDKIVPEHRTLSFQHLRDGQSPGGAFHKSPMYRLPMLMPMAAALLVPVLGAARGAYEHWRAVTRDRYTMYSRESVATLSHQQIRMAEVSAEIDAAELFLRRALDDIRPGGPVPIATRARIRRDYAFAGSLCLRAVERLYNASGGAANFESSPLQRYWRDIHAMVVHSGLNLDAAAENFGRMELGLPLNPKDPLF